MKTISLIRSAIDDLIKLYFGKAPAIHDRHGVGLLSIHEIYVIPDANILFKFFARHICFLVYASFWPVTVAPILGMKSEHGQPIPGWIIAIPIDAETMNKNRDLAKEFIIKAARLAEHKGLDVIALGAMTASLTRGGLDIAEETTMRITTGRLFTAKNVTDLVEKAAYKIGYTKDAPVGIVGAAGSIASASAQILAHNGYHHFLLIERAEKQERVMWLASHIKSINPNAEVTITHSMDDLISAEIIVTATSHPDALIRSEHVRPGAIIIDDAQPSDVDKKILETRPDVLVSEGGLVSAGDIHIPFNFGLKKHKFIYSCLAEAVILASIPEVKGSALGELREIQWDEYADLCTAADQLGFTAEDLQNTNMIYDDSTIAVIRNARA